MVAHKHRHHIIPRHAGGDDSPDNIIEVTVEEHAELHLSLYLKYGRWQDWAAYHGLAGIIDREDVVYFVSDKRKELQSKAVKEDWESEKGKKKRERLSKRNREVKSEEIKKAWSEGKYDDRIVPGRPKGVKETKPRKVRSNIRPISYDGRVYPSCAHLARELGTRPANVRYWANKGTNGVYYV